MALHKIKDFDPDYRNHFDGDDVKDLDLYAGDEKIGSVNDVLVDENGQFRYLIINTGAWIFGKKVMLPIGRARIDYSARRVYADGLTRQQVEALPEFTDDLKIDYDHEEQVRGVYRSSGTTGTTGMTGMTGMTGAAGTTEASLDASAPLNSPTPVEGMPYTGSSMGATTGAFAADTNSGAFAADTNLGRDYDRDTYNYDEHDRDLFDLGRQDDRIRLYQERLIASKTRQKTGEVTVGKHVETETARVDVPVEKERVVIERVNATDTTAVTPGEATFTGGEVARVEVYEETPDIHKEAFVREEVRVKKVVDQDTVTAEDEVRREELDIDTQGRPIIDNDRTNVDRASR
ncbi:MAG: DUF2382 domain-containing protein [Myxacorys californica WJT36-NPBG1]|jgi:uncharacterized protein (TIGR02271 family)|nr:DUF2382 domain-containing protein [Myxacorys californica WJT36-NPBG1]